MPEKTLYQQLAECIGASASGIIPEIFKTLANDDEAGLLLAASPPATIEELSQKTGLDAGAIEKMIDPLFRKGLIYKSKKGDGIRYYRVRHMMQMHDATAVSNDAPRQMLDLWKKYMATEWIQFKEIFEKGLPRPYMRVLPVNVSIESKSRILAFDDIKSIIENAGNIAVTKCSCRNIDGACGKPIEVCIQLDRAADYALERGTGRQLSKSEAIEMIKKCEEDGLVHVGDNRKSVDHVICNCCKDCCMFWPSVKHGAGKLVAPSRFKAEVNDEICSGCDTCLDSCFFDALTRSDSSEVVEVNAEKCMGCGLCIGACPEDAISLKETRSEDYIPA